MANKYHAYIDGVMVGTRTSQSRTYTHCIAVKWSKDYALCQCSDPRSMAQDRKNYDFYMTEIDNGGDLRWLNAQAIADAKAARDRDHYAERMVERYADRVERRAAEGYYGTWQVVTWCGRPDLAQKAYGQYANRRDVEAVRIVEATQV